MAKEQFFPMVQEEEEYQGGIQKPSWLTAQNVGNVIDAAGRAYSPAWAGMSDAIQTGRDVAGLVAQGRKAMTGPLQGGPDLFEMSNSERIGNVPPPAPAPSVLPTKKGAAPPPASDADLIAKGRKDIAAMKASLDRSMNPTLARQDLGLPQEVFPPSVAKSMGPAPTVVEEVKPKWQVSDPTLKLIQMSRTPEERANLAPTLDAKLSAMFPGMSKSSRGSLTQQLYALVQPQMPQQAGEPNFGNVASALAEKPTYKTLSAGQTLYQIDKSGNAKQVIQAPGEPGAMLAHKDKQTQQAMDMYKNIRTDYRKTWDKISEDYANDPVERAKALDKHNAQYFASMGVPVELAEVPVSFKAFADKAMQENKVTSLSSSQVKSLQQVHNQLVKQRNQMLKNFWGGKLQFGGYTEKSY